MPIWEIFQAGSPGPAAQNLGFRHLLMAAVLTGKSVLLSPFVQHRTDDTVAPRTPIPVGLRMDLEVLCQYVKVYNLDKLEAPGGGQVSQNSQKSKSTGCIWVLERS